MTAPIKLSELRAVRAAMARAGLELSVTHNDRGDAGMRTRIFDPGGSVICNTGYATDAAGLCATHNAADVLIEVVQLAKELHNLEARWIIRMVMMSDAEADAVPDGVVKEYRAQRMKLRRRLGAALEKVEI